MIAPELPEQYNIESTVSGVSIDKQVVSILKKSLDSPILSTGTPVEIRTHLDSKLPRKGVSILDIHYYIIGNNQNKISVRFGSEAEV